MSSDAALEAAKARLARGESDFRVTPKAASERPSVTSVTVQRCEGCGGRTVPVTVACEVCGDDFVPRRSDAKVCSHRCRQRAYRARHA